MLRLNLGLTLLLPGAADGRVPWSTFAANALGCLLIGLLSGWLSRIAAPDTLRLFLTVGLCGGFTTFSTFVADGRALWQQQLTLTAIASRPDYTLSHSSRARCPVPPTIPFAHLFRQNTFQLTLLIGIIEGERRRS